MMPAIIERLGYTSAANTLLARAVWIDLRVGASSILRFVRDEPQELTPPGILHGLGKYSLCQAQDVQLFDGDQTVIVDQFPRLLVMKICPLPANTLVNSLQYLHCFTPPVT